MISHDITCQTPALARVVSPWNLMGANCYLSACGRSDAFMTSDENVWPHHVSQQLQWHIWLKESYSFTPELLWTLRTPLASGQVWSSWINPGMHKSGEWESHIEVQSSSSDFQRLSFTVWCRWCSLWHFPLVGHPLRRVPHWALKRAMVRVRQRRFTSWAMVASSSIIFHAVLKNLGLL